MHEKRDGLLSRKEGHELTASKLQVEVIKHSLTYASEEMGIALKKSAYSPNIRERADHSCAILDQTGRTLGQAEHIPVHIGSFSLGLKQTFEHLKGEGIESLPGDMFIVNDPYISGTHLNDVTVIRPVFLDGNIIGYAANKAHHVDVGGSTPASINPLARELSEEGVLIPPMKLMEKNDLRFEAVKQLTSNARMPETTLGDLRAQIAANLLGERRILELAGKTSLEDFEKSCELILDQTHKLAMAAYAKLPKGSWKSVDYVELGDRLPVVAVMVTITDEGVEVDFNGSEPQVPAPLNAVLGVTTAASTFAIRTLMPRDLPLNDGFIRTIHVKAPEGSIVNPHKPAPVAAGNLETSQRIVDAIYKALSEPLPKTIPAAAHGSMNNLMMGGTHPVTGKPWAFYETNGGGYGGRFESDGVNAVQVNMTNTLNTPIEVMEHYYPVMFRAYRIRDGSGGAGKWRGGLGIERSFTTRARIEVTVLGDRCKIQPYGLNGGLAGKSSEYSVARANDEEVKLDSKDTTILEAGDTLTMRTAGGGGFGQPHDRDPSLVRSDIENHCITSTEAAKIYHYAED
ncbi:MAG: hydantoinase B/oxoprolinase family protein [Candidatus Bathyarchaeia archaeon]